MSAATWELAGEVRIRMCHVCQLGHTNSLMAATCEQTFALNMHEIVFKKQLLVNLAGARFDDSVLDSVFRLWAPEPSHQPPPPPLPLPLRSGQFLQS